MCGIAGLLNPQPTSADALHALVRRMGEAIAHRGPDGEGTWIDGDAGVALAHRRLAIVDLSPQGAQPMVSACGRYVVVLNGEIYNHAALRAELGEGLPWRGHSDTESLLAAFTRWGIVESLPRLVGMFAIAVWDRRDRTLTLARDRIGEKPLYWARTADGSVIFGSELRALRAHSSWRGGIDREAVALYLRYGAVPSPYTIHPGVFKLEPGCWLRFAGAAVGTAGDDRSGEPTPGRYWSLIEVARHGLAEPLALGDDEAADALEALLAQSVRGQLMSDVPLGAFLSGGVDSSTVVALMARHASQVRSFSIGFRESGFDESAHARAVAAHLGTQHTELIVTADDALAVVPTLPDVYDEPFADSSQVPTALLAALTRRHVTVALSGDGGDELFAGYNRHLIAQRLWRRVAAVPAPLRRGAAAAVLGVRAETLDAMASPLQALRPVRRRHAQVGEKLHKFAQGVLAQRDVASMYRALVSLWPEPAAVVPGAREPRTPVDAETLAAAFTGTPSGTALAACGDAERLCLLDQQSYLPDDILVKVDRAAMAVALETRVPLLDHRIVEFTWRLPIEHKIRGRETKWLLRRVLDRYVPRALIDRPKQGFAVPLADWLRGPLKGWAQDLLAPSVLARQGLLDVDSVRRAWAEHLQRRGQHAQRLWAVLQLQAWIARHGAT